MPNLILPIKATYESVTRLATHSVIRQVMTRTGLSDKIPVRFPGETETDSQPGSSISGGPANLFEHHSKVNVTVEEEYKDDAVINSPVRYNDAPYIFEDKALDVLIKPIYSYTAMSINFEYRAATRTEVEAWRNDIKVRLADNRTGMLHELDYHYEVPEQCLLVLAHLHELREARAGYGEDLSTWFKQKFTKRTTVLTTMAGKSTLMVVGEKAIGVQGWFEFIEPTQAEKDTDGASWTVSFVYKFNYQKPVSVNFIYPLVVHNQLIDDRLFSMDPPYSLDDRPSLFTETKISYDSTESLYRKPPDPLGGIRTPNWDEWIPATVPNYTTTMATWLLQVEEEDPSTVLNLHDLGDQYFIDCFIEFLEKERDHLTKRGHSLVYFTLFKGIDPLDDESIYVDEHLCIRTRVPMDMRETYHIRFGIINEKSILNARAKEAILDNGCVAALLWQSMFPNLDIEYIKSIMIGDCRLPNSYYDWIFGFIRDQVNGGMTNSDSFLHTYPKNANYRGYYIEWPLVSILTVIAEHKEDV